MFVLTRSTSFILRLQISVRELALKRGKTAVIVGAQWGDEGKGKIVDVLSENFSVVARYAGGHNAGHTVIIGGKKFVLQLRLAGGVAASARISWRALVAAYENMFFELGHEVTSYLTGSLSTRHYALLSSAWAR